MFTERSIILTLKSFLFYIQTTFTSWMIAHSFLSTSSNIVQVKTLKGNFYDRKGNIHFDLLKLYACRSIVRRNHKEKEVLWITISWVSFFTFYHFYILMDMNGWVHSALLVYGCSELFFGYRKRKEKQRKQVEWKVFWTYAFVFECCPFWSLIFKFISVLIFLWMGDSTLRVLLDALTPSSLRFCFFIFNKISRIFFKNFLLDFILRFC